LATVQRCIGVCQRSAGEGHYQINLVFGPLISPGVDRRNGQGAAMSKTNLLGPWVRRFLLEYLVSELNLARNTQRSYRDTLGLLLPFVARHARKEIDEISVMDVSPDAVRLFLRHLEESRKCAVSTRNQRLAAIHSLARFVG